MSSIKRTLLIALGLVVIFKPIIPKADEIDEVANEYNEVISEEKDEFKRVFHESFTEEIEAVEVNSDIKLDGKMNDWTNIPYIQDNDKYGPHNGENFTGFRYYVDKSDSVDGKPYLYLNVGLEKAKITHIRIWGVKNKDTFNKFLNTYENPVNSSQNTLISMLENDKAGVFAYSANIEKLTSSEPYRVQVLNHNASYFKEQGYWATTDNGGLEAEFRVPLDGLVGDDGSLNFDLVLGTDLYNYPTADFMIASLASGSTGPMIAVVLGVLGVVFVVRKMRG
ncbi:MAG: hypothetical protein RR620_00710 [Clostridium sp.]